MGSEGERAINNEAKGSDLLNRVERVALMTNMESMQGEDGLKRQGVRSSLC